MTRDDELRAILPDTIPGSPDFQGAPGVAPGRTGGFTCVGNFVSQDPAWASAALLDELTKRARGIHELHRLVDDKFETSVHVRLRQPPVVRQHPAIRVAWWHATLRHRRRRLSA